MTASSREGFRFSPTAISTISASPTIRRFGWSWTTQCPSKVMIGTLFEPGADLSRDGVGAHLARLHRLGLLTIAENARLNGLGLQSRMPNDWRGDDALARYRHAGIAHDEAPETSTVSTRNVPASTTRRAAVTGSLKRRGPALPGLT